MVKFWFTLPKYENIHETCQQHMNILNATTKQTEKPVYTIHSAVTGSNFIDFEASPDRTPKYRVYTDFGEPFFIIFHANVEGTLHWEMYNSIKLQHYRHPQDFRASGELRISATHTTIQHHRILENELAQRVKFKSQNGILSKVTLPTTTDLAPVDALYYGLGGPTRFEYPEVAKRVDTAIKQFNSTLIIQADDMGIIKPERFHFRFHSYLDITFPLLSEIQPYLGPCAVAIDHVKDLSVQRWTNYITCIRKNDLAVPTEENILTEYVNHDADDIGCKPNWFHKGAPKTFGIFIAKNMAREFERERRARGMIVPQCDVYQPETNLEFSFDDPALHRYEDPTLPRFDPHGLCYDHQRDASPPPETSNDKLALAIRTINLAKIQIKQQFQQIIQPAADEIKSQAQRGDPLAKAMLEQRRPQAYPVLPDYKVDLTRHADDDDSSCSDESSSSYSQTGSQRSKRHSDPDENESQQKQPCLRHSSATSTDSASNFSQVSQGSQSSSQSPCARSTPTGTCAMEALTPPTPPDTPLPEMMLEIIIASPSSPPDDTHNGLIIDVDDVITVETSALPNETEACQMDTTTSETDQPSTNATSDEMASEDEPLASIQDALSTIDAVLADEDFDALCDEALAELTDSSNDADL